jgi:uncharacterized protein YcaQ
MKRRVSVSAVEARRIAFAAQGFDRPRPLAEPNARHFRRIVDTLGLLQLDFVNVLMPAQYMVVWSRLGAYQRPALDKFIYGSGNCTEQWAHEASIVPTNAWPLLAHRRASYTLWKNSPILKLPNRRKYLQDVLQQVEKEGGLTASELPPVSGPKRKPGDWHRSVPRMALEYHFGRGALTVANRMPNFQRVYDLPERVIPPQFRTRKMPDTEAKRELLRRASRALGIATLQDLADYYRMTSRDAAPHVQELVDAGDLSRVAVEGWTEQAFLASTARSPRNIAGCSLLSPFDPMVWFRPRALRLFDFHYRIEIYVPEVKRKWGYYVLPFRLGDKIVARVDLKADRQARKLFVQSAHAEPGIDGEETIDALGDELRYLSEWLELDEIVVRRGNSFSKALSSNV